MVRVRLCDSVAVPDQTEEGTAAYLKIARQFATHIAKYNGVVANFEANETGCGGEVEFLTAADAQNCIDSFNHYADDGATVDDLLVLS
jgi:hypothetical protein